jgi:two-component system, chemotaxis family, protein-glutamate methylesterase/glutaminase
VARIRVITHPRARLARLSRPATPPREGHEPQSPCRLVAIGASTGGPGAIVEILRRLPVRFKLPILFILHIAEPFGAAFAEWLEDQSPRRVDYPSDGERVATCAGRVIMAPPGQHLVVRGQRLWLNREPERHSCRPSIDVLFESIARDYGAGAAACLLTGMGRDGAAGLLRIREAGGLTIAQDEASSVVFGMPREAVQLGAASRVLPLGEIAPALAALETSAAKTGP